MDSTYNSLADRILHQWAKKQAQGDNSRILIALAGPPGSGKTTIAHKVAKLIPASPNGPSILVISADGFHFPLSTLRSWSNATEALARRGAPWTFDGDAIVGMVHSLQKTDQVTVCPTFDHAIKDPVRDGLIVDQSTQICILEGNYLLSDEAPWGEIAELVDDRWLVQVDSALARDRVAIRHLEAGIEETLDAAYKRVDGNDMPNGEYVAARSKGRYDLLITSIEEA
ncbi:phosphoribulokinase/uridine kinase [Fusarium austroafricanum]|uniref:Phosphoribulokinase/uridine kinase n=1 Tax=Fusarium austroafricanum TaxID=2364996 RepID=A0A8H4P5C5_9HYPO|nr:phosphoribulokinase/uridine kinase [Fusarium austroafricanum]